MRRLISTPRLSRLSSSRGLRPPEVLPGSIAYSAVSQPLPLPTRKRGTSAWTVAVQITRVRPKETRQEPAGCSM